MFLRWGTLAVCGVLLPRIQPHHRIFRARLIHPLSRPTAVSEKMGKDAISTQECLFALDFWSQFSQKITHFSCLIAASPFDQRPIFTNKF
jgi:hypothetical protein